MDAVALNKENSSPNLQGSFHRINDRRKDLRSPVKPPKYSQESKHQFNRLLKESREEIATETDENVALQFTIHEARMLVNEWKFVEEDYKLAEELVDQLDEEVKQLMYENESLGEMEALRIAIEERRQWQYDKNMRVQLEANDSDYVMKLISEEIEEKKKIEAKDLELAKEIDDIEQQKFNEKVSLQYEKDFEYAKELQDKMSMMNMEEKLDHKSIKDEAKTLSTKSDHDHKGQDDKLCTPKIPLRYMRQCVREEHRQQKRIEKNLTLSLLSDLSVVGKLWQDAEADVEDVMGGICLTLVLPHLKDLKVNVGGAGHNVVNIKATRMITKGDRHATRYNTFYVAEFTIAGTKHITEENLSYEYSSESGILHVYIDRVSLDNERKSDNDDKDSTRSTGLAINLRKNLKGLLY